MRRIAVIALTMMILVGLLHPATAANVAPAYATNVTDESPSNCPRNNGIKFLLEGYCLVIDEPITLKSNRILLPMREVLDKVGGSQVDIQWYNDWKTACGATSSTMVCFPIGLPVLIHDGELVSIDQPAIVEPPARGRTKVPLRFLLERFGIMVNFYEATQTVSLHVPSDAFGQLSVNQACVRHGYGTNDKCPAGAFFTPLTYTAFRGVAPNFIPGLASSAPFWGTDPDFAAGVIVNANRVAFRAIADGSAPRLDIQNGQMAEYYTWGGLALGGVMLAPAAAVEAGLLSPWLVPLAQGVQQKADNLEKVVQDAENGWQLIPRINVGLRPLLYQARICGTDLVRSLGTGERFWRIREFVWRGTEFDGVKAGETGETVFLEAKSMDKMWEAAGRYFPQRIPDILQNAVDQAARQLSAVANYAATNNVTARLEWHVEDKAYFDALRNALQAAGLLEGTGLQIFHTP